MLNAETDLEVVPDKLVMKARSIIGLIWRYDRRVSRECVVCVRVSSQVYLGGQLGSNVVSGSVPPCPVLLLITITMTPPGVWAEEERRRRGGVLVGTCRAVGLCRSPPQPSRTGCAGPALPGLESWTLGLRDWWGVSQSVSQASRVIVTTLHTADQ